MTHWLDGTVLEAIPGAVEAGLLSGFILPWLGMWVVLLRVVFLGITLAQVAAAGVALGLVLGSPPLATGLALTLLVVFGVVRADGKQSSLAADSKLGAIFCVASALALLFVSRSPAELDEVQHLLHGNLIFAGDEAVRLTAITLVGAWVVLGLFFQKILLVGFDRETAQALGLSTKGWLMLLFTVLATVLTVSMRTTGSLLTFAMLVLPAMAALALRRGLIASFALASLLGGIGTLCGLLLAVHGDLHLESSITVCLAALLPLCAAWRRHWLLGLGVAAVALIAGWSLAEELVPQATPGHLHHHQDLLSGEFSQPWHVDVELSAKQPRPGEAIKVTWLLTVHRRLDDDTLPKELWILLTGDDIFHQHQLTDELAQLPEGTTTLSGSCLVPASGKPHRIEGQLWTGSMEDINTEPVAPVSGSVLGTDVGI
jgi:ABC-type Mn2+/Zn2+ transport system permease subunit